MEKEILNKTSEKELFVEDYLAREDSESAETNPPDKITEKAPSEKTEKTAKHQVMTLFAIKTTKIRLHITIEIQ